MQLSGKRFICCLNPIEFFNFGITLICINGPLCSGYTWRNHKIKYALNYIVYIPGDNYIIPFFTNLTQFAAHKFATTSGLFAPAPHFSLDILLCLLLLILLLPLHLPLSCGCCSILFGSRLCAKVRVIQFFMRRQAASVCTQRGVTVGGAPFGQGIKTKDYNKYASKAYLARNFDDDDDGASY